MNVKDLRLKPLQVVNLGLEIFADELRSQNVPVVGVHWRPPAGGKPHLLRILEKLEEVESMNPAEERGTRARDANA